MNSPGKGDPSGDRRSYIREETTEEDAVADRPTILIIGGDDIGVADLSCCSHGLMGSGRPHSTGRAPC